jgi:hypothetical protein
MCVTQYIFEGRDRVVTTGWSNARRYNRFMFFRRERPKTPSFSDRLESVKKAGFTTTQQGGGAVRISRGDFGVDLKEQDGSVNLASRAGVLLCGELASLVDGGFQKFFRTADGKQRPAIAEDLKGLHDFEEDLREAFGQDSYYNESLGTVSTYYLYDRVEGRDRGVPKRVWE